MVPGALPDTGTWLVSGVRAVAGGGRQRTYPNTGPTFPCRVYAVRGKRQTEAPGDRAVTDSRLLLDDATVMAGVKETDRMQVGGVTYEVVTVARPRDGQGVHHAELELSRVAAAPVLG